MVLTLQIPGETAPSHEHVVVGKQRASVVIETHGLTGMVVIYFGRQVVAVLSHLSSGHVSNAY